MSGLLPNPDSPCPHTRTELFIEGTQPTETDTFYRHFKIDAATGQLADANTPPSHVVERTVLVLPAEALDWARENDVETGNALLANADRQPPTSDLRPPASDLQLTHPDAGTVYQISPVTPRETQRIAVSALAGEGVQLASLSLWVDGEPITTFTEPPYRVLWMLQPGTHTFIAHGVDQSGRELASPPVTITVLP
jgi:hypothetical protein